jgi:hypothetical protein
MCPARGPRPGAPARSRAAPRAVHRDAQGARRCHELSPFAARRACRRPTPPRQRRRCRRSRVACLRAPVTIPPTITRSTSSGAPCRTPAQRHCRAGTRRAAVHARVRAQVGTRRRRPARPSPARAREHGPPTDAALAPPAAARPPPRRSHRHAHPAAPGGRARDVENPFQRNIRVGTPSSTTGASDARHLDPTSSPVSSRDTTRAEAPGASSATTAETGAGGRAPRGLRGPCPCVPGSSHSAAADRSPLRRATRS